MQRSTISMFAQLVQMVSREIDFQRLVVKHNTERAAKGLTSWSQFIAMLYCQLTGAESLREISDGLFSSLGKLQHIGASPVSRSSLSYANSKRTYKLYEDLYYCLLEKFRPLLKDRLGPRFNKPVYSLDSTTISLCLKLFEWAQHRRRKGGIKLHTLLNNNLGVPEVIVHTPAKVSDIKGAKPILANLAAGTILVMDRGYNDYSLFQELTDKKVTFVTRLKSNAQHSHMPDGLIAKDPEGLWGLYEITFTSPKAQKACPQTRFRVLQWYDQETKKWFEFLTNSRELEPLEIQALYRDRWQIELFFKRIKQNLVIKTFVGTSENAVMTQIWTAAIAILLLEILRQRSTYPWTFCRLTSYFRLNLMTCKSLHDWLNRPDIKEWDKAPPPIQGDLFGGGGA